MNFACTFDEENSDDIFSLALKGGLSSGSEKSWRKRFGTEGAQASASLIRLLEYEVDSVTAERRAFTVEAY